MTSTACEWVPRECFLNVFRSHARANPRLHPLQRSLQLLCNTHLWFKAHTPCRTPKSICKVPDPPSICKVPAKYLSDPESTGKVPVKVLVGKDQHSYVQSTCRKNANTWYLQSTCWKEVPTGYLQSTCRKKFLRGVPVKVGVVSKYIHAPPVKVLCARLPRSRVLVGLTH